MSAMAYAAFAFPLVAVLVLTWYWNRNSRRICLREIEAAGGFEAWKKLHFE